MKKTASIVILCFLLKISALAQYEPVFPGLSGQELLDNLVATYKPPVLLPQAQARDTLFARIYSYHDTLTCVYTGYKIYLDPTQDPTQAAFALGINTEHTFPQSLGAMNQAEGDMHHLYPTREDVNADRGNLPFAEIPDNQTETWYYNGLESSNIPTSNIDLYSERKAGFFEPREDHKGNVARAMFYFYTMYKAQADAANSSFFESQRQTLCAWHLLDPVDEPEWNRTWLIAQYQSGKPNPFVLDCTLPERCYCAEFNTKCTPAALEEEADNQLFALKSISPNPFDETTVLHFVLQEPGRVRLEVFDAFGNKLDEVELGHFAAGEQQATWTKKADTASGICFFMLYFENGNQTGVAVTKVLILPR
ncbi:MAG: endonuclease I [Bacteroidetes bacterium]|nr:endonuclease I [Bacteroidota bacterium]